MGGTRLIIFGTRYISWGSELNDRETYCTRCGNMSRFTRKTRMRFGHIFWVPLLPLSGKQEVYRCTCGATYDYVW